MFFPCCTIVVLLNFILFSALFSHTFSHTCQKLPNIQKLPLYWELRGRIQSRRKPFPCLCKFCGKARSGLLAIPRTCRRGINFFRVREYVVSFPHFLFKISASGCMRKIVFSIAYSAKCPFLPLGVVCKNDYLFCVLILSLSINKGKKFPSIFPIFQEFRRKKDFFPSSVNLIHFSRGTFQKPVCRGTVYIYCFCKQ